MLNKFLVFIILFLFLFPACNKKMDINQNLERKIVCFGDSLTNGYGSTPQENYPSFLQDLTGIKTINLGVNGDTSLQGLNRIDEVIKEKAFMVIVEFGANDFFQQINISYTKNNILEIVRKLKRTGCIVVLVSTHDKKMKNLYLILKEISKNENIYFIDGILNDIFNDKSLLSDFVHPNSKGYKKVAQKIYKNIIPVLKNT